MDSKTSSECLDKFVSIIGDISQRILETNEPARIKKISALRSCSTDEGEVCIKTFFEELQKLGICPEDPRLKGIRDILKNLSSSPTFDSFKLDANTFRQILAENIVFVTKAFKNRLVIPDFEVFCKNITRIYYDLKFNETGEPDEFLKSVNHVDETKFGIAVCTVDGQRFSIGDAKTQFSLQALARPITYGITLNELDEEVHKFQGREPSGRQFGEIVLDSNNKPFNPYVNPGGIMSASLLIQKVQPELDDLARKYEYVHNIFEKMAGGELVQFNNSLFLSEKSSKDRDCSLAYFMRENKCFPPGAEIKKILDFYSQLGCLEMNCDSNSVMAGTLANGGICPITEERVFNSDAVQHVLSLMSSCGMGIYSGQFAFNIGLPAMSSDCGAMMLIIPNVAGITIFSPKLDTIHNPVRALEFCQQLINVYQFHKYDNVNSVPKKEDSKIDPTLKKSFTANEKGIQLLFASANGDLTFLRSAFFQGIDMNICDYNGRTPLHLAAAEGQLDCVKFLIGTCQVDPDPKDRWNHTPISEAVDHLHPHIVRYLKKFMREKTYLDKEGNPYQVAYDRGVTTI